MGFVSGISFGVACFQVSPCSQEMVHDPCRCQLEDFHFEGFTFLLQGPGQCEYFHSSYIFTNTQLLITVQNYFYFVYEAYVVNHLCLDLYLSYLEGNILLFSFQFFMSQLMFFYTIFHNYRVLLSFYYFTCSFYHRQSCLETIQSKA